MGIRNPAGPLAHCLGYGVLQGGGSGSDRVDLSSEKTHSVDVQGLALRILFAHVDFAFQVHQGRGRGGGDTVLSCACLGNNTCFAHFFCQQNLPQHIVDFVGAGMV